MPVDLDVTNCTGFSTVAPTPVVWLTIPLAIDDAGPRVAFDPAQISGSMVIPGCRA